MNKHHLCIYDDYTTFDSVTYPYGAKMFEEKMTAAVSSFLDEIIPKIGDGEIILCGHDPARRMIGRKLEDRLQRPVNYE